MRNKGKIKANQRYFLKSPLKKNATWSERNTHRGKKRAMHTRGRWSSAGAMRERSPKQSLLFSAQKGLALLTPGSWTSSSYTLRKYISDVHATQFAGLCYGSLSRWIQVPCPTLSLAYILTTIIWNVLQSSHLN